MKIEDRVVEGVTILDISGKITIGEGSIEIKTLPSGQKSHRFNHLELASQESCKELS